MPSTKPKQSNNGASFRATACAYLCKYGGCKKINSITIVCDGDDNKKNRV